MSDAATVFGLSWEEWTQEQIDSQKLGLSFCKVEQADRSALFALDLPSRRVFYSGDRPLAEKAVARLLSDAGWAMQDGELGIARGPGATGAPLPASRCARKDCADPGPFYAVRFLIPAKGEPPGEVPAGRCVQLVPDVACCVTHRDELATDIGGEVRFRRKVVDTLAQVGAKAAPDFARMRWTFEVAGVPRGETT